MTMKERRLAMENRYFLSNEQAQAGDIATCGNKNYMLGFDNKWHHLADPFRQVFVINDDEARKLDKEIEEDQRISN